MQILCRRNNTPRSGIAVRSIPCRDKFAAGERFIRSALQPASRVSPTAEAFYRSGPNFWQRYTSFWLTSLLNRIVLFVIPVVATLIPIIGFALPFYRWLNTRRIDQLHRDLGKLELAQSEDKSRLFEYQTRIAEIESAVRSLKVARSFEVDLHRLRVHLRMVQEHVCGAP
jgi:hypothetical protein